MTRWGRITIAVVLGLVMLGVVAVAGYAAKDDTELVSRAAGTNGTKGDHYSLEPAVSGDGRYVAFSSTATNLDPDDNDGTVDVFVRDRQTNTTTLVSRASGTNGIKSNGHSLEPVISPDGRYVAFRSAATNLDPDDNDSTIDVFVRDRQTNTTTLVSRANGPHGSKGNDDSYQPEISSDGRYIAFWSFAKLAPEDTDVAQDVYVRELQTNTTMLVSRAGGANGAKGNNTSTNATISSDGRYVTFQSYATNLDPDDIDGTPDVFLRDLQATTTTLVSRASGASGAKGNNESREPAISADARYITFTSEATNLGPDDMDATTDVLVRDRQTNTTTLVSRASGASGAKTNDNAYNPVISADGRYITFESRASNLDPDDNDSIYDVFVRDLQAKTTALVSRASGANAAKANSGTLAPAISAAGRYIAFDSYASNLDPDDTDTVADVFVRDVLGPPLAAAPGTPTQCPSGTSPTVRCLRDAKGRLAMEGTGADETFIGTDGRDRISPRGGNDTVFGNGGNDLISGGPGRDELHGGPGKDRMNGNAGNDRISGNEGNDRILGRSGNDRLTGQAGRDRLNGGTGNDNISGGRAADRFHCGPGTDTAHTTHRDHVDDSCRDG